MTKIGIIAALRSEARCLSGDKLRPGVPHDISHRLSLVLSGMSEARVNTCIESLLAQKLDGLISFGTAGALSTGMNSGDIVVPENIFDDMGNIYSVSSDWRDTILQHLTSCPATILKGDLLTTNRVISDIETKKDLREKTGAIAVDMESAHITAAANRHNLPTVTLRFIVDDANMSIPNSILNSTDAFGQVKVLSLATKILLRPLLIQDLIKLGRGFRAAKHSMDWIGSRAEQILLPGPNP
ncbi:MAG: adenosylhomocysteine nucleosidase [Gammaproteobacteria bacterium]